MRCPGDGTSALPSPRRRGMQSMANEFDRGLLIGLLIGEGHFGGDGRQPHVTLRMHARHEPLFRWLEHTFPGGRLYGPYEHGGRRYFQWMARGAFLREQLLPLLEQQLSARLDEHSYRRLEAMKSRYAAWFQRAALPPGGGRRHGAGTAHAAGSRSPSRSGRRSPAEMPPVQRPSAAAVFDQLRRAWPG
jgi:hypothetical protein